MQLGRLADCAAATCAACLGPQELRQQLQEREQLAAGLQDELAGMQQAADSLVRQLAEAQGAQREAQAAAQAAAARAAAAEQQLQALVLQQDEDGAQLRASFQALKQQVAALRQAEQEAKEQQAALQLQLHEANAKVGCGRQAGEAEGARWRCRSDTWQPGSYLGQQGACRAGSQPPRALAPTVAGGHPDSAAGHPH